MNAESTSVLSHVVFDNLSNPADEGWQLTGAVTFYEAPVRMSHVVFAQNRSEDALHLLRSRFEIEQAVFANTSADALDIDFGEGSIADSRFTSVGNDAIDVSGSLVEMHTIVVTGAGGKALSFGERSEVKGSEIDISGAEIAVASKNDSLVTLMDLRISDGAVGLTSFQTKPEFRPASIVVHGLQIADVRRPHLVELESSLSIDGKPIPATEENLRDLLY